MKRMKKILGLAVSAALLLGAAGCGSNNQSTDKKDSKNITIGVCPGPYGDMTKKAIMPILEKKGYKVSTKEFSDYVEPNKALANKEIDANIFQHGAYLKKFSSDNNLKLSQVIVLPTAGMGIFSHKEKSLASLPNGAQVAIPNDASNLARALTILQSEKLIKIKANIDQTKASTSDIVENKKNLKFIEVESAQLPRSLDTADIALVPGNYVIASKLNYKDALGVEKLVEQYKEVIAVRTEDLNGTLGKDLKAAVESKEFKEAIEAPNGEFKDFQKPAWWK